MKGFLFLFAVIIAFFLPSFLSECGVPCMNTLLDLKGKLKAEKMSFLWLGPQTIQGLSYHDKEDRIECDRLIAHVSLPKAVYFLKKGDLFNMDALLNFKGSTIFLKQYEVTLENLDADISFDEHGFRYFDLTSALYYPDKKTGSVECHGELISKDSVENIDIKTFDCNLNLSFQNLPVYLIPHPKAIELFGKYFDSVLQVSVINGVGDVHLDIGNPSIWCNVFLYLEDSKLHLRQPFSIILYLKNAISKKIPLLSFRMEDSVNLHISDFVADVSFSSPFMSDIKIRDCELDLGKIIYDNNKLFHSILKVVDADLISDKNFAISVDKMNIAIEKDILYIAETTILLNERHPLMIQGSYDYTEDKLDINVYLTEDLARRKFDMKTSERIPLAKIEGTLENPKIDIAPKISAIPKI